MIERHPQLGHLAQRDLALVRPRAIDDPADTQHGCLGIVDDRCSAIGPEHPVVVQRERATGHLGRGELVVTGELGQFPEGSCQLGRRHLSGIMHNGHDKSARRLSSEAQVDVAKLHDLLGFDVHPRVELWKLRESGDADPREQRQQTDAGNGVDCLDLVLGGHQAGRVDVDPGGRRGDLASAPGQLVRDRLAHATERSSYVVSAVRADRADDIRTPLRGVRKTIADKLTRSRREIPAATTWVDVDATGLMAAKDEIKAVNAVARIGLLALFARISIAGLTKFPELNARVDVEAQEIVQLRDINLSFDAQSPRGLVVPVVHDAGEMTTAELAAALRELTELARDGKLTPAQMTGGTFTLNNYGVFGTDGAAPIINYPEAAMLGVGRIIDRPWAHHGQVALRKVAQLGLTFDHRVCDGGTAGGFLRFVADCVERPALLLAES